LPWEKNFLPIGSGPRDGAERKGVDGVKLTDLLRSRSVKEESEEAAPSLGTEGKIHWREEIVAVPIEEIRPSPYQPRQRIDEGKIEELAASIAEHGLLHPVVVRMREGGYELVVGERRWRACRRLGWRSIPAVVKALSEQAAAELALIENLQRKDLDFFEEAEGYQRLITEFDLTQEELAKRIGCSQSAIANKLRLLRLHPEVREAIISREMITERHARALLRLGSPEEQLEMIERIAKEGLSVKKVEQLIAAREQKGKGKGQRWIGVIKDMRPFMNSLRKLTAQLERAGLAVRIEEEAKGQDEVVIHIRIGRRAETQRKDGS
jgi:ParB family chromosome partitioning protein